MSDGDLLFIEDKTDGLLGRHVHHDPQNKSYPARGVLFAADAPLQYKVWPRSAAAFDQGRESSCTMQSAAGVLFTDPFRLALEKSARLAYNTQPERYDGYRRAQDYDPWAGRNYEGSSTDAPFKMLRAERRIREWRWCFGFDDVVRTLSHYGPVGIGINWKRDMMDTDHLGFIRYTGSIMGGHAVELRAINPEHSYVSGVNSWGGDWGNNGKFRMSFHDLRAALEDNGEAVTIVL